MTASIKGKTQPRLWTPPLRKLTRATTAGYSVCDFAEAIGEPFLPWQRWLAIHAMELMPDGTYRFGIVLVLVGRQQGKSTAKRTISLWRLYIDGARLVLGVAQDVSLAREQWQYCLDTIQASAELSAELDQVRRVNGDEWFRLAAELDARGEDAGERELSYDDDELDESLTLEGGGRYKIAASNRKAGRGLSVDELNIDELREQRSWAAWSALSKTTLARPAAQTWCMSNAGDEESVVLNALRETALSGKNPRIGLFEWSAPDDCELGDLDAIRQACPGLGYTISLADIELARDTDPPGIYRTEILCQKVDQLDGAVDYIAWKSLADPAGTMNALRDRIAAVFDAAPDGQHFALLAAARLPDGRVRLEVVKAWTASGDVRGEIASALERVQPRAFGWYPGGPAAELSTVLRPLALRYNRRPGKRQDGDWPEDGEIKGAAVSEVCQEFAGLVRARSLVHADQALLNDHIRGASKLHTGDGWRFTRKGAGHVNCAYAAAGAVKAALMTPEPKRSRIRFITA